MLLLSFLFACRQPPAEAAPEFNEALLDLLAAHDASDEDLETAATNFLNTVDGTLVFDEGLKERAALPDNPSDEQISSFNHTGRDPDDLMGMVVGRISPFSIGKHWPLQLMEDQRPIEPYCQNLYDREFLSGGDCWLDDCTLMETENQQTKENILMTMTYTTRKDFRSIRDGEGYVAWSWTEDEVWDEGGNDAILQSFSVDIWVPEGTDTLRVGSIWSETVLSVSASEDLQNTTTMVGLDKTQRGADDYLSDLEEQ